MKINREQLVAWAKIVNSPERKNTRAAYYQMYLALNGGLAKLIAAAIKAEFKNPDAVKELQARLVPINILKKVTNKIAAVYIEPPTRQPVDESQDDEELLEDYQDITKFNIRQKQANRYLELFKKNLKEIFPSDIDKKVLIKNQAPHTYEVFNVVNPDKAQADVVCKIVVDNDDLAHQVLHFWSDESFWVTNGEGQVDDRVMAIDSNPSGENFATVLPFVYKTKSTDSVDPIMDESLLKISVAIPIVLTDLFYACKYQCWSMIYTIGVSGDINRNPSSVVSLQRTEGDEKDPVIGQINPTVDSDKVIGMIEATLNLFLSSIGMSGGTLSTGTQASDVVSGVSKILDSAEVIEGKKDQQDDMLDDENMTWDKIISLIPYWRRNNLLAKDLDREFSKDFKVSITFKEPKPLMSEKDSLEISDKKIKQRLTTWTNELKNFYPDYSDDQIEDLKQGILDELAEYPEIYNPMMAMMDGQVNGVDNPNDALNGKAKKTTKVPKAKNGVQSKVPNKSKTGVQ